MRDEFAIRVQKNIPMPVIKPRGLAGTNKAKYPWLTMAIGDSFLFPASLGRASHAAVIQASKSTSRKFKVCKTDDGYRCWRIA